MRIFSDERIYILDGAMGTEIMKKGPTATACFEELNLLSPGMIADVHRSYVDAGADIIETNTFGGSRIKLSAYGLEHAFEKINHEGISIAKKAAGGKALVAASMGPLGELLEPMGSMGFDRAFEEFSLLAGIFEKAGADLISIETMSDLQEARAALIAVKSSCSLPVIVHMTYDASGRTISGTPPEVACRVLSSLGADAIGANCSTGPADMLKVAKKLINNSPVPVSIMANAGSPELDGDTAVYRMTPKKYLPYAVKFAKAGAKFIGGCCGTTPEHIALISKAADRGYIRRYKGAGASGFAGRTRTVDSGRKLIVVGERINPTNRKDLQQELLLGRSSLVRIEAVSQSASGADLLDINVGFPEINEAEAMKRAVLAAQSGSDLPLSIDSSDTLALEEGLKSFAGKALVNSVNGKEESLSKVLPLVKKYGAAVIGLTLDEGGIKSKAEDRLAIAKKVVGRAISLGIPPEDIYIDVLTLSAGAQQSDVEETLKAVKAVKRELKVRTILGVSNISHGLPQRKLLNQAFLKLARKYGLDAAIYNPDNLKVQITPSIYSASKAVFMNRDKGARRWISMFTRAENSEQRAERTEERAEKSIRQLVIEGDKENILAEIEKALAGMDPQDVIDEELLPGMEEVGKRFSTGEYFIPQVMASAEAMKAAFERVKKEISSADRKVAGTVVIATVLGDIHDIGKNIVAMLLENHGFRVIDLGRDVRPEAIVSAVKENKADIVMLSALLTTTMPQMKVVKKLLDDEGLNVPVMVGGAPVTDNYARSFKAGFAKDAVKAVEEAKKLLP